MDAREVYVRTVAARAGASVGGTIDGRTVVRADPRKSELRIATSYPLPGGTVIECDPAEIGLATDLLGHEADSAITTDRWIELAVAAGGEHLGSGNIRVLVGQLATPEDRDDGIVSRSLDRDVPGDVETIRTFAASASEADLVEADLDVDELDPCIVGLFDGDTMVAYGSGRPADDVPELDDIGVLTHPSHRRLGLGARAVASFVEQRLAQDPSRLMMYRCNVDNIGSNGIAVALGFELVHTIGAVRLPS